MRTKNEARSIFTSSAANFCMKTIRHNKLACLTHSGLIFQTGQDTHRHNGAGYWHEDLRQGQDNLTELFILMQLEYAGDK